MAFYSAHHRNVLFPGTDGDHRGKVPFVVYAALALAPELTGGLGYLMVRKH
jgi:hypothetical protein